MPIKINVQKVPAKAILEKKKAASKASVSTKRAERKQKYVDDATLFGSQLFEAETRREKEIIIVFLDRFTLDRTRFSTCGRFAYRPSGEFYFDLFYCLDLIKDYSDDFVIIPNDRIWLFSRITVEEMETLCCKLVQAEFAENRKLELEKIFKEEKKLIEERRLEEEKMDSEFLEQEEVQLEYEKKMEEFETKMDNEEIITLPSSQKIKTGAQDFSGFNEITTNFFKESKKENESFNISNSTNNSNVQLEEISNQQTSEESINKIEERKSSFKTLFSKEI